jgi:transcriptional regulator with XRE-family HTH domain
VTQPGWASGITRAIADELRRYRAERGLSAQQLADRCAKLGLEISRATITDLENGRRIAVSVAELIIMARALEISPIALITPVGRQETMEIFPGQRTGAFDAALWFSGHADLVNAEGGKDGPDLVAADIDAEDLSLYYQYADAVRAWRRIADRPELLRDAEVIETIEQAFHQLRARIGERGLIVPPLPHGLEHLDKA